MPPLPAADQAGQLWARVTIDQLSHLPSPHGEVLFLLYFAGLNEAQIGAQLGLTALIVRAATADGLRQMARLELSDTLSFEPVNEGQSMTVPLARRDG